MSSILAALVYEPQCGGGGGVAGSQPISTRYNCAHRAQINFGDLTPVFNQWVFMFGNDGKVRVYGTHVLYLLVAPIMPNSSSCLALLFTVPKYLVYTT
jgi:hypothetical protein